MTREEAIKDIQENIKPFVGGKSLDMAIEALKAEPIKHGWWIWDKENDKMYCSECGYETDNWGVHQESDPIEWQLPNYCENCGAKMGEPLNYHIENDGTYEVGDEL